MPASRVGTAWCISVVLAVPPSASVLYLGIVLWSIAFVEAKLFCRWWKG